MAAAPTSLHLAQIEAQEASGLALAQLKTVIAGLPDDVITAENRTAVTDNLQSWQDKAQAVRLRAQKAHEIAEKEIPLQTDVYPGADTPAPTVPSMKDYLFQPFTGTGIESTDKTRVLDYLAKLMSICRANKLNPDQIFDVFRKTTSGPAFNAFDEESKKTKSVDRVVRAMESRFGYNIHPPVAAQKLQAYRKIEGQELNHMFLDIKYLAKIYALGTKHITNPQEEAERLTKATFLRCLNTKARQQIEQEEHTQGLIGNEPFTAAQCLEKAKIQEQETISTKGKESHLYPYVGYMTEPDMSQDQTEPMLLATDMSYETDTDNYRQQNQEYIMYQQAEGIPISERHRLQMSDVEYANIIQQNNSTGFRPWRPRIPYRAQNQWRQPFQYTRGPTPYRPQYPQQFRGNWRQPYQQEPRLTIDQWIQLKNKEDIPKPLAAPQLRQPIRLPGQTQRINYSQEELDEFFNNDEIAAYIQTGSIDPKTWNCTHDECFKCGQMGHTFRNDCCPFRTLPLLPGPCPKCHKGGHSERVCAYNVPSSPRLDQQAIAHASMAITQRKNDDLAVDHRQQFSKN